MDAVTSLSPPKQAFRLGSRMTPRRLAAAMVLLALAVRIIGIGVRPLWLDEAYSAWFSSQSWQALWTEVPTYEPHPPFYYSLLKLWRELLGGSPLALRSFSLLLAAATIPLVIAASGELERARPSGRPLLRAGIAAFLVACSPMLVLIGEEARPYPLLVFAYALGLLGMLRLMREFSEGRAGEWRSWLMLACGAEVGLWAGRKSSNVPCCTAEMASRSWLTAMESARGANSQKRMISSRAAAAAPPIRILLSSRLRSTTRSIAPPLTASD